MTSKRLLDFGTLAVPLLLLFFVVPVSADPRDGPNASTAKIESAPKNPPLPATSFHPLEPTDTDSVKILSTAYDDIQLGRLFSASESGTAGSSVYLSPGIPESAARAVPGDQPALAGQANLHGGAAGEMERLAGPPASTAPMTAGEKFHFYLTRTFKPPEPYVLSVLAGLAQQSFKAGDERPGTYFVNSMEAAGRNFAFRVTSNFFSHFAYATAFKQDPRFHRTNEGPARTKIERAIFRAFITQDDRNERNEVNYSFLLGNLSAAAISNVWEPKHDIGVGPTFQRWAISIGTKMLRNLMEQYIGR
jgi:hypothetical protein